MNLRDMIASLPARSGAVFTLEGGKPVRRAFSQLGEDVQRAREKLRGWKVGPGMRVGIYSPNSYQWLVHDLALIDLGAVSVPFTDDFTGRIDAALLDKYQVALLLIAANGAKLFPERPAYVAFLDSDRNETVAARTVPDLGDDADCLSLAFSSGSAGGLKGLVISRKGAESTLPPVVETIGAEPGDRLLLFLPMSNFQQRMMCYAALQYDFDIIIVEYAQLFAAIKTLHPTILIAPPLFYQLVHARFVNPTWLRLYWTIIGGLIACLPGEKLRRTVARMLFKPFYNQLGPNMRQLITGMAPLGRATARFFAAMQMPLSESYGLVETGSLTYRPPGGQYGSVGKPLPGVTFAFEADGEIIVQREASLTLHYFESAPGENEKTFVAPGRIATGDIGRLDAQGNLQLLGRKKEIIVAPSGYKVHPEVLEDEINDCPDVAQSVVFHRPGAATLSCVVVPNKDRPEGAAERIRKFADGMGIAKKMRIAEIIVADAPFSVENGMLRPNLKVNRRGIEARYRA